MAVGAQRTQIMRLVIAEGFVPVTIGIIAGIILSVISMPLLDHLLFEIKPTSLAVYFSSVVLIIALSGLSMLIPALRAMRIDPLKALARE
jgi:ABC-type antimicrobial peptide transport system permease subunit